MPYTGRAEAPNLRRCVPDAHGATCIHLWLHIARRYAGGRIWLLPDQDKEGLSGFQDLLWKLQQYEGINARPGWPGSLSHIAEPENLTDEELATVLAPFLLRS